MAGSNSNYSIILDAVLNEESIKKQLREIQNNKETQLKIKVGAEGGAKTRQELDSVSDSTQKVNKDTKDLMFTYQQFRQVLDSVVDIAGEMANQVKALDAAQTEFKKVSDLSGQALDAYQQKLSAAGKTVGRTGKPNRSEPVCCDGKAA